MSQELPNAAPALAVNDLPKDLQNHSPRHAGNTPYRLLDAWRGVAALWVVLLHARGDGLFAPLDQFSLLGLFGVPMFFVISGYCIANAAMRSLDNPKPVAHFAWARIRRIYPPYFFASLVTILLATLLALLVEHHILNFFHRGPRYYFGALTLTQPLLHVDYILPVFWSLSYEAAFYAIVAVLLVLAVRTAQTPRLLDALGAVTVITLVWLNLAEQSCPYPWNRWPQFGLGVLVYQILSQPERKSPRIVVLGCSVLMLVWTLLSFHNSQWKLWSMESQALFCVPFAAVLLALFRWDRFLSRHWAVRLFSWIGMFSYSLYLIHYVALRVVIQGAPRIALLGSHPLLLYLVKIAAGIVTGWLFFYLCERPFLTKRRLTLGSGTHDVKRKFPS